MIKKLICLICSLALICSMFMVNAAGEERQLKVFLNHVEVEFDIQPQIINDKLMLPLRTIAEKVDAVVTWNDVEQTALIIRKNNSMKIQVNNKNMILNDETIELETPPIISDNKVLVPIRDIAVGLNLNVIWDEDYYIVLLNSITDEAYDNMFTSPFSGTCNQVYKDFKSGKYGDEMFILVSGGTWGGDGDIVIYIEDNTATLVFYQDNGCYKTRQLSKEEFQTLKTFVQDNKIDNLTDWDNGTVDDGIEYQYLHCFKNKTIRFGINNPGVHGGDLYADLVNTFFDLTETGDFETYYSSEFPPNPKILIKNEDHKVQSVWKKDDDFRVLIKEGDQLIWHKFNNNTVGETIEEPTGINLQDPWGDIPKGDIFYEHLNNYPWEVQWNSNFVRVMGNKETRIDGLWLTQKGEKPKLIKEGTYANPIVIPNTDWVVCSKADQGWASPNTVVKINLKTFEEFTLPFEPDDNLNPVAYCNNRLLIARNGEMYLYDIATDHNEKVEEDFSGLFDIKERFFQSSSATNEYYTVESQHILGKLNVETFQFTPIAAFNSIYFDSMNVWVDEQNQKAYIVTNNDLLEVPINLGSATTDTQ